MTEHLRPAAFLDRDGVIIHDGGYVYRNEDLELMAGAAAAIRRLNAEGYLVIVATNQSGVARGYFDEAAVESFHTYMRGLLESQGAHIDAIYTCPFHPEAIVEAYRRDHPDRKPHPGMLLRAFADWPIDRTRCFMIGDKASDMDAAANAGIAGHLFSAGNLDAFVAQLLHQSRVRERHDEYPTFGK